MVEKLKIHFGELTVTRGNKHTFLGMNITMRDDGKFEIDQKEHILEAIEAFGEDVSKKVSSIASSDLFKVDETSKALSDEKSVTFHSVSAKLLYVMQRARPDSETAVSFMCSRVSKSTKDDWRKLRRVLRFLNQTIDEPRIIGASSLTELFTWIDAAFGVHHDMRSQTGGCMSFGWGTVHSRSSKQKLNTISSTEAEIVGASEYYPRNIFLIMFLEELGYCMRTNVLYQDNQSAIKMEKNGKSSTTGKSRHVHIRYFFLKDRVSKGEVEIQYCPTSIMLADYFTKPLQGALFRKYWNVIMGRTHIDSLREVLISNDQIKPFEIKERVEDVIISNDKENEKLSYKSVLLSNNNDKSTKLISKNKKQSWEHSLGGCEPWKSDVKNVNKE